MSEERDQVRTKQVLNDIGQQIARQLDKACGKQTGFCLILFEFREGGWLTYTSNVQRGDMKATLKEMMEKL